MGDAEVSAAVIRSRQRLTYEQVADVLAGRGRLPAPLREWIVLRLASDRLRRGATPAGGNRARPARR